MRPLLNLFLAGEYGRLLTLLSSVILPVVTIVLFGQFAVNWQYVQAGQLDWLTLAIAGSAYFLFTFIWSWYVYRNSITCRFQDACVKLGIHKHDELYPRITAIRKKFFRIDGRGFKVSDFEQRRAELSSYMRLYIRDIKQTSRLDRFEVYYSEKDLPAEVPFKPDCRFGELVLGYGSNGYQKAALHDLVHVGVSGITGSGKSVLMRCLITQIMLNYPRSVIIGIDFKQGAEFSLFERFPNFILCHEHHTAGLALSEVFTEYRRRADYIKKANKDNAYEIIGKGGERISPVFVMVDEAAEFFARIMDKEQRTAFEESTGYINKLSRLARFAGIHLVIATQRASIEAIPQSVRSMLAGRICFKVRQKEDSIMFLGSAAATDLPDIKGRFLFTAPDGTLAEMQGMWLSKDRARGVLARATRARSAARLYTVIKTRLQETQLEQS